MKSESASWSFDRSSHWVRRTLTAAACGLALTAALPANAQNKPFVARYTSNGALDASWGSGGILLPYTGTSSLTTTGGKLMSDGRVAFGGHIAINAPGVAAFASGVAAPGQPLILREASFPDAGAGGFTLVSDSVVDSSNRNVVVGSEMLNGSRVFALMRFMPNGTFDGGFDRDGRVLTNFASSTEEEITSVALAPDGKIVVAGRAMVDGVWRFAVARYNTNGALDTTFAGDGKALTTFPDTLGSFAHGVAVDSTGKVVAAGYVRVGNTFKFAVARYNVNGTADTSFDGDGMAVVDFVSSDLEVARAVLIDSSNRIICGGYAFAPGAEQFALARLTPTGALDTSFDGDGKVLTDFSSTFSEGIYDLAFAPGNRIVAIGSAQQTSTTMSVAAARYNSNGSLDTTFDFDGKVLTPIPNFSGAAGTAAAGLDSSGRLHVVGVATP